MFCLAAVIFPMGFHVDEIGGQPYQLPNSHQVGISYILFVLSLWIDRQPTKGHNGACSYCNSIYANRTLISKGKSNKSLLNDSLHFYIKLQ